MYLWYLLLSLVGVRSMQHIHVPFISYFSIATHRQYKYVVTSFLLFTTVLFRCSYVVYCRYLIIFIPSNVFSSHITQVISGQHVTPQVV
jgi:hypothetical protein